MPVIRSPFHQLFPDEYFTSAIAVKHGLVEALIISNVARHLGDKRSDCVKEHDGQIYVRSSATDMRIDMPYLTVHQIRRAVERLIKKGVLSRVQLGGMDRSLWITLAEI